MGITRIAGTLTTHFDGTEISEVILDVRPIEFAANH